MASRIMHLAISYELEKVLSIKDKNRFCIGHLLPDAVLSANKWEINTHFVEIFDKGKRKHFNFYEFFDKYKKEIISDELYLGYYLHLIQDSIFRTILYNDLGLISLRRDPVFLNELYRDYHILNGWAVKKYGLKCDFFVPDKFKSEKINKIFSFEIEDFINDMKSDFKDKINEQPKHFKIELAKKFIEKCVEICSSEYKEIMIGNHAIGAYEYYWKTLN